MLGGLDVDQVAAIRVKRSGTVRVLQHKALRRLADKFSPDHSDGHADVRGGSAHHQASDTTDAPVSTTDFTKDATDATTPSTGPDAHADFGPWTAATSTGHAADHADVFPSETTLFHHRPPRARTAAPPHKSSDPGSQNHKPSAPAGAPASVPTPASPPDHGAPTIPAPTAQGSDAATGGTTIASSHDGRQRLGATVSAARPTAPTAAVPEVLN